MSRDPRPRKDRRPQRSSTPFAFVAFCAAALFATAPAGAQDLDDLDDLDEGVVLEEVFEPGIEPNTWEVSASFGQADLAQDLLESDQIIVDVEESEDFIVADMKLAGEASFHPLIRIGRTLGRHFALEIGGGFAVGDFEQELTSDPIKLTDPLSDNEFTEEEREKGSYFSMTAALDALWYPRGEGRVQPYVIGSIGQQWMELDSVYVDGMGSSVQFGYGIGLRVVGDDLYSFRLEVRNSHSTMSFDASDKFVTVVEPNGGGLIDVELGQLDETVTEGGVNDRLDSNVEYDDTTLTTLSFTLGFVAAF